MRKSLEWTPDTIFHSLLAMSHPDYSSDDSEDDGGGGLSLSAETMAALRDFALASGIPTIGALYWKVDS